MTKHEAGVLRLLRPIQTALEMSLINRSLGDLGVILLTRHILTSWWASMLKEAVGPTWDDLRLSTRSTWDGAKP